MSLFNRQVGCERSWKDEGISCSVDNGTLETRLRTCWRVEGNNDGELEPTLPITVPR